MNVQVGIGIGIGMVVSVELKFFWTQNFFRPNIFFQTVNIFLDSQFFYFFFSDQNLDPQFFSKNFPDPKFILATNNFFQKNF